MEEAKPKIQLSEEEFVRALREGKAIDINGKKHDFCVYERLDIANQKVSAYKIEMIEVKEDILARRIISDIPITLFNCHFSNFHIMNSEFNEGFELTNVNTEKTLSITRSKLKSLSIFNCNLLRLSVMDTAINHSLTVLKSKIETDINIVTSVISGFIHFHSTPIAMSIYMLGSHISNLHFTNIKFKNFVLPSIPANGTFKLQVVAFESLSTDEDFTNLGYMKWNDLRPTDNANVEIINSVMGKWDIVNCNFSKTNFTIHSSKITDAFYTNTKFPNELKVPGYISEEKYHDILRDGYNQLKTIAQKQNDRKLFLHYQAAELDSFFQTLGWNKKDFTTKIQLWALKCSSDFGTNWLKGVCFTLAVNALFLAVCYWNYWPTFGKESFWSYAGKFGEFLFSVVKKPDFVHAGFQTFIYYTSRIFIAFGIYQTIAAFRKFGKSE